MVDSLYQEAKRGIEENRIQLLHINMFKTYMSEGDTRKAIDLALAVTAEYDTCPAIWKELGSYYVSVGYGDSAALCYENSLVSSNCASTSYDIVMRLINVYYINDDITKIVPVVTDFLTGLGNQDFYKTQIERWCNEKKLDSIVQELAPYLVRSEPVRPLPPRK